jgi:hypothetical protein
MASSPICAALLIVERKQTLIIVKAIEVVIILYSTVCLTHAQDSLFILGFVIKKENEVHSLITLIPLVFISCEFLLCCSSRDKNK